MSKPRITRWTVAVAALMMLVSILCGVSTIAIALAIANNTFKPQQGVETLPPAVAMVITFVMFVLSLTAFVVAHRYHGDCHTRLDQLSKLKHSRQGRGQ